MTSLIDKLEKDYKTTLLLNPSKKPGYYLYEGENGLQILIIDNTISSEKAIERVEKLSFINDEVRNLMEQGVPKFFFEQKLLKSRYILLKEAEMNANFEILESGTYKQYSYTVYIDEALWIVETKLQSLDK